MKRQDGPTANSGAGADSFVQTARPTVMGPQGVISTGHYLATAAGMSMLTKGGNAVDAGVAAGLCLNVVHNDMNTLSGVAPIVLYDARQGRTVTLAGVGRWPSAMSRERLLEKHGGIPDTLERCVVPAAAASWLQVLRDYGTFSFAEVSEPARHYAREGFPVHTFMRHAIGKFLAKYRHWEENRRLFLVDDAPPPVGTVIRQGDLSKTLEAMVTAEGNAAGKEREEQIQAVIDHFYRGPIAERMVAFSQENGGVLSMEDMATFTVREEPEARIAFGEWELVACGPWSQGPAMTMATNILRNCDLTSMEHNSVNYVNTVASALDLAFADRNAYCGDPEFVEVPLEELLSEQYGRLRVGLIPTDRSFDKPPYPGDPLQSVAELKDRLFAKEDFGGKLSQTPADTSCVTVVDRLGNFFAATPSDGYCNGPIIPGLGLHISERGSQAFLREADPNVVQPGKRPRLTPNPLLIFHKGKPYGAMASPGNDRQVQAMLQVFLNLAVFKMTPQEAVEAPRFASYNFRASSWPGNTEPGRLCLEQGIDERVGRTLTEWGRNVAWWPRWCWSAGGVCISLHDSNTGMFMGASDPRREGYAIAY